MKTSLISGIASLYLKLLLAALSMKTMVKLILLLWLVLLNRPAFSQTRPPFMLQQDDTLLRRSYLKETQHKKETLLASLDKKKDVDYKTIYEQQYADIIEVWKSDRVVTAPVAHTYLQAVLKKIIDANAELRDIDVRVVFTRDWWPNAVSLGDGSIVFNAGLFVYLSNEAELAYVLSHELAHYYLQHSQKSVKKYVETINSESYQSELKKISKTEYGANKQLEKLAKTFFFDRRRHGRDHETEADRYAFMFLKKTGYECSAIRSCLQLLDRVDDTLFAKPLQLETMFDFPDYPFKKKWIQNESSIFSQLKNDETGLTKAEADSLKTHPDCSKRIAMLEDSIKASGGDRDFFLVDENRFQQLKKDFLVEMTEQCFRDNNLSRNLYYSLLLLQSEEHRAFAIYSVARCLNRIYLCQKEHTLGLAIDVEHKSRREDYNLLLRMLRKIRLDEIASMNYQFCSKHRESMKGYKPFEDEGRKAQLFKN